MHNAKRIVKLMLMNTSSEKLEKSTEKEKYYQDVSKE